MPRLLFACAPILLLLCCASIASAQVNIPGFGNIVAGRQENLGDHWILTGSVELERESDQAKLYASEVEYFQDEDRAIARGNVVLSQGNNRIAADWAEFNTKTLLGTFYHAQGIANVQPPRQAPRSRPPLPRLPPPAAASCA